MKIKLTNDTFKFNNSYIHTTESKRRAEKLTAHAGAWVDVDTTCLFKNQYTAIIDGEKISVLDSQITAVADDVRPISCKCSYCGATFTSDADGDYIAKFNAHIANELTAINKGCENCFYNRSKIVDTKHETTRETAENGDVIETKTTVYTWRKACEYSDDNGNKCTHAKHASAKMETFNARNTYFIKYPNGYDGYFKSLNWLDAWRERDFAIDSADNGAGVITFVKTGFVSSYALYVYADANTHEIKSARLANKRASFDLTREQINNYLRNYHCFDYAVSFKNEKRIVSDWDNFPKTLKHDLTRAFDATRDFIKRNDYAREMFFADGWN